MSEKDISEYFNLLNYVRSNNSIVRLKQKQKIRDKKIVEYSNKCKEIMSKQKNKYQNELKDKDEKIHMLEQEIEMLKQKIK